MSISPWYENKFFRYTIALLLILMAIFLFYHVTSFIVPILSFLAYIFVPIIVSFPLYYLLRPIVTFLSKWRISRTISILSLYCLIAALLFLFITYSGPILTHQISSLANFSVGALQSAKTTLNTLFNTNFNFPSSSNLEEHLLNLIQESASILSANLLDFIKFLTRATTILILTPFILFYLLRDDHSFLRSFIRGLPEDFQKETKNIIENIDATLTSYITGLVLVSSSLGILLFIGYIIIGLKYALTLSIIAFIFTTIPFLGPFLAIAPALLVGLAESPFMALKVVIVFTVIQQLESNLISPQIIGNRLHIHPLTIILLLLAAGSLYGLVGLILATPTYAIAKILIENLYKIYLLQYSQKSRANYQNT